MYRKALVLALVALPFLALAAAPPAEASAGGTSVEVSLTIKISGGKSSNHRAFIRTLTQELEAQARNGKNARELGTIAEARVADYDRDRGDKFAPTKPGQTVAKAKWEVSLSITIKGGGSRSSALDPPDQTFLQNLEREMQRKVKSGSIGQAQAQSQVESAIAQHIASEQQAGRSSGLGQRDVSVVISIKIKF